MLYFLFFLCFSVFFHFYILIYFACLTLLLAPCSRNTARSLSRTAGGATEFITATTQSRTVSRVQRQLKRAQQPALGNIAITWADSEKVGCYVVVLLFIFSH